MKANRHTTEQIINKLRGTDALLNGGQTVATICKHLSISQHTYYRRCKRYSAGVPDA